jgi:hypothetical protein
LKPYSPAPGAAAPQQTTDDVVKAMAERFGIDAVALARIIAEAGAGTTGTP